VIVSLQRRFIFAGFMNLSFAPFIVIYLLLLYFFRYFEVLPPVNAMLIDRNTTRTLALSVHGNINPSLNGNSANSTSCTTSSKSVSTLVTNSRQNTSISSPRKRQLNYQGIHSLSKILPLI